MEIQVKGTAYKLSRREIKRALLYYGQELFPKRSLPKIRINLSILPDLKHDASVFMEPDKSFSMELRQSISLKRGRLSLAHEMVHVHQYWTGRLMDYSRSDDVKWEGTKRNFNSADARDYWFSPWEIEANGLEYALYTMYKKYGV